jgi:1-acyl-sn-glycerol-3-phosphate acyltransferase
VSDRRDRGYSPAWRKGTEIFLPPLFKSINKRDYQGHQHFPRHGGMIVAANHLSYLDWPSVAQFTHEAGRYPAFLIKATVFNIKLVGSFLRIVGQLPVQRGQTDAALVLKDAERGLAEGECLIFYPEGTATRDPDLWPMVAKTGVARLALATGVPVVPIAHWGAQDILRYGSTRPHLVPRRTVHMLAGPPVDLSSYLGKPLTKETLRGATDAIMADITGLLAEIRGEQPPAVPYDPATARRAARQDAAAHDPASQPEPAADEPGKAPPP